MTIEIHQPELEAIILERMQSGRFENIEDVLIDAFRFTPSEQATSPIASPGKPRLTISQVFAAARGYAEDLDVTRDPEIARPIDLA